MNGHQPDAATATRTRPVRGLRRRTSPEQAPLLDVPDRRPDAGRPVPLPQNEREYLYVTEAEIRELAEGRVPVIVQQQARVALMSTEEWVRWIRRERA